MNHESPENYSDTPPVDTPNPRAVEIGAESIRVIQEVVGRTADPELRQCLLAGYLEHGAAFAAYLRLDDTAPTAATVVTRFAEAYVSSWKLFDQLIDDTLEGLGWSQALQDFCAAQGIDPDYLT